MFSASHSRRSYGSSGAAAAPNSSSCIAPDLRPRGSSGSSAHATRGHSAAAAKSAACPARGRYRCGPEKQFHFRRLVQCAVNVGAVRDLGMWYRRLSTPPSAATAQIKVESAPKDTGMRSVGSRVGSHRPNRVAFLRCRATVIRFKGSHHCSRSASAGSTLAARAKGGAAASTVQTIMMTAAPAKDSVSSTAIRYNWSRRNCARNAAMPSPTHTPINIAKSNRPRYRGAQMAAGCANRHPNPKLTPSLRNRDCHSAVQSGAGRNRRDDGEANRKQRNQPLLP